jgi:hypothetical protein
MIVPDDELKLTSRNSMFSNSPSCVGSGPVRELVLIYNFDRLESW